MNKYLIYTLTLLLVACFFSSCIKHERLVNFNNGPAFPDSIQLMVAQYQIRIQPDDILSIGVGNLDPTGESVLPYNRDLGTESSSDRIGYLVDRDGNIDFPGMGTIKVSGLTTKEVKMLLLGYLGTVVKNPVVDIRFLNFRVTVTGEVGSPGVVQVPGEKINLLQALGAAGDPTPYGNRENILIIREQDGHRSFAYLNLQDRAVLNDPYFYLRQNDIIYVEPIKQKRFTVADPAQKALPWISAIITLVNLVVIIQRTN